MDRRHFFLKMLVSYHYSSTRAHAQNISMAFASRSCILYGCMNKLRRKILQIMISYWKILCNQLNIDYFDFSCILKWSPLCFLQILGFIDMWMLVDRLLIQIAHIRNCRDYFIIHGNFAKKKNPQMIWG